MDSIKAALLNLKDWFNWMPDLLVAALILGIAAGVAHAVHKSLRRLVRRLFAERYPNIFAIFTRIRELTGLALLILAMIIAIPIAPLDPGTADVLTRLLVVAVIGLTGWAAIVALHIGADIYLRRYRLDVADNLLARKHNTQIRVLLRTADGLIVLLTLGFALMTFEPVRQFGVSLFASAGLAGIVAGFAARPVLSNLIAGVQLAMTQPIRLEDSVVVENEFGNIEEITATYVVVRLWDLRRLIVPLSYFIEKPFQSWTRDSSALIGSVMLYLDYRAPVARIRDKLNEIVRQSKRWDGRVVSLQVTEAKEYTIEVRCLASAGSASDTWDLRCEIREKLIDFLQREHPEALPRRRNEAVAGAADDSGRG